MEVRNEEEEGKEGREREGGEKCQVVPEVMFIIQWALILHLWCKIKYICKETKLDPSTTKFNSK